MKFLISALSEPSKKPSMMRIMSLMCCITAIIIVFIGILKEKPDYSGLAIIVSPFLTAAMTGKAFQKSIENLKNPA